MLGISIQTLLVVLCTISLISSASNGLFLVNALSQDTKDSVISPGDSFTLVEKLIDVRPLTCQAPASVPTFLKESTNHTNTRGLVVRWITRQVSMIHDAFHLAWATVRNSCQLGGSMDPFAFALLCIPIGAGVLAVLFLLKIAAEPNSGGADTDCSVPKGPLNAHDLYSALQAIQDSTVVTKDNSDEVTSTGTSTRPVSFDYSDTDLSASVGVSPPSYETLMETMSPIALSEESAAVDQKLEKIPSYSDGMGHQSLVEPHIMSASTPETPISEVAVLPYLDSASVLAHSRGLLAAVHGKPKLPEMDPKSTSTRLIPVDSLSDMGDSASSSPVTSPAFLLPMQGEDQIFDQDVPVTAGEGFIPNDSDDDSDDEFVYTGVDYKPDVAVEAPVTKANASDGNEGGVKPVVDLDSDDDDDFIYTGVDS